MEDLTPSKDSLDPIEIASRDEIAALQLDRMKWSLRHAYENVPFYRQSFDAAGVHPDDLTSLAGLAQFPFTVKTDLRDNYPFGMFAVPREKVRRIHASSGTTGQPTVVGYTDNDLDAWGTVVARSLRAAGLARGTCCTTLMATVCSPGAWAFIWAPTSWVCPRCRFPVA